MENAFSFLWLPFLVTLVLVGIHTFLGRYVLARNIVFVDLALAQIAGLGATLGFIFGHAVGSVESYGWSFFFTLTAAVLLAFTRSWSTRLPQEALIGIIYVVAASIMFLMVEKAPQGTEHIKQLLTGNILTVDLQNLWIIPLYAMISLIIWCIRHQMESFGGGFKVWIIDFIFYASFGIVVTSSVAIAGVLLVFSLLVIPVSIGKIYFDDNRQVYLGWVIGTLACFFGLLTSYFYDLNTSSSIVCSLAIALALAGIIRLLKNNLKVGFKKIIEIGRVILISVLMISAIWVIFYPKKDHPLIDSIEFMYPEIRFIYLNKLEKKIQIDVQAHSIKYKKRVEDLNKQENDSRWKNEQLTEEQLQNVSSFLKIYNEMIKGENYVLREVVGKAKERNRFYIAAVFFLLSGLLLPFKYWGKLFIKVKHSNLVKKWSIHVKKDINRS
jgi:zinc/manganese transport system permease protein